MWLNWPPRFKWNQVFEKRSVRKLESLGGQVSCAKRYQKVILFNNSRYHNPKDNSEVASADLSIMLQQAARDHNSQKRVKPPGAFQVHGQEGGGAGGHGGTETNLRLSFPSKRSDHPPIHLDRAGFWFGPCSFKRMAT